MTKKNHEKAEKKEKTVSSAVKSRGETDDEDMDSSSRSTTLPILVAIAISMAVIVGLIIVIAFGGTIKEYLTGEVSLVSEDSGGLLNKLDLFGWFSKDKIEVPNFINMKFDDVLKKYPDLAIENPPQYEYNSSYEDGRVCNQYPDAGAKVSKDTVFKLTVATSNQMVLIRDVSGLMAKEAETVLKASGLEVELMPVSDETKNEGTVLYTDPSSNTYTEYKGTVYVFYASSSQDVSSIRVPNVVGYELEAAKAKIVSAGLKVGAITRGASAVSLKGFVISQSPNEMTAVNADAFINLIVGNGVPSSNTAVFKISLPSLPEGSTSTIKTYLNNNAYDSISGVSLDGSPYQLSFTGTGSVNSFKIYVDSVLIYSGNIDFTTPNPSFSNVHNYQVSTKESVPNVVGLTESSAQAALSSAGFNRIRVISEVSSIVPAGTVISQTPVNSATAKYTTATTVTIIVSVGDEATETTTEIEESASENNETTTVEIVTDASTTEVLLTDYTLTSVPG